MNSLKWCRSCSDSDSFRRTTAAILHQPTFHPRIGISYASPVRARKPWSHTRQGPGPFLRSTMSFGVSLAPTALPPDLIPQHELRPRIYERAGVLELQFLYRELPRL